MNIAIIDDDKNFLKIFSNKVKSLSVMFLILLLLIVTLIVKLF